MGVYGDYIGAKSHILQLCCTHGIWTTGNIDHLVNKGTAGCTECGIGGFKRSLPARFYINIWTHEDESIVKFGITNQKMKDRLREQKNKNKGWAVSTIHTFYHENGGLIADTEVFLKKQLKDQLDVPKSILPDGYTEAFFYNQNTLDYVISYAREALTQPKPACQ